MGIRRSDRVVVRPDGTVERASPTEVAGGAGMDTESLGDRFEELLETDPREAARESDTPASRLQTPARVPWRDPAQERAAAAASQAAPARSKEQERPKESGPATQAGEDRADARAEAGAQAGTQAKGRKSGEHEGGQHSGEGGQPDGSGAMMALAGETAAPRPAASGPVAGPAPERSGAAVISEVASQVAARITAGGQGSGQVRIDLRDDVLPQTSLTVEDQAGVVVVTLSAGSSEAAELLSSHAAALGQAISRRTGRATRIDLAGRSWSSDADQDTSAAARPTDDGPEAR
jgi:hypothetical protein